MEVGISTASFYSRTATEDSLCTIAGLGAAVCEVFLDSYSEYEPDFGALLQNRTKQLGLRVCSVHAMSQQFEPQLASLSRRQKQDAWDIYEKVLRQARLLGADRYVMHGPGLMRGALRNAQLSRLGPIIAELAELAKAYGVRLCWENVSWCMFNHPAFAKELLQYAKSDNLFFTLDIKQAARSGYDPFEYLWAMGDRLGHVHLCDFSREGDKLLLSMPGKGSFDFARLGRTLRDMGYAGDAMVEPYSDLYEKVEEVGEARARMEALLCL